MSLSWEDYFMSIALLAGLKSKDTYSKNGAIIVDKHKRIISTWFNWFVAGIDESAFSWDKKADSYRNTKYPYVLHAEENAILHAPNIYLDDTTMYCKKFPCNECAKKIAQKKIKEVIYYELKNPDKDVYVASRRILDVAWVEYSQYKWNIDFEELAKTLNIEWNI